MTDTIRSERSEELSDSVVHAFKVGARISSRRNKGFSHVRLGYATDGSKVAIKVFNKRRMTTRSARMQVNREVDALMTCDHPRIVRLIEVQETEQEILIIMDYLAGGELFEYIDSSGRLNEVHAMHMFLQLLESVEYIHKLGIVHRDIKCENILLDTDGNAVLIDFGFCSRANIHKLNTYRGSPHYSAPEVLQGKTYDGVPADIWSCGVVLFAMLNGQLPFYGTIQEVTDLVSQGAYIYEEGVEETLSEEVKDLIHRILNPDPMERYTIEQIRDHPWVKMLRIVTPSDGDVNSAISSLSQLTVSSFPSLKQRTAEPGFSSLISKSSSAASTINNLPEPARLAPGTLPSAVPSMRSGPPSIRAAANNSVLSVSIRSGQSLLEPAKPVEAPDNKSDDEEDEEDDDDNDDEEDEEQEEELKRRSIKTYVDLNESKQHSIRTVAPIPLTQANLPENKTDTMRSVSLRSRSSSLIRSNPLSLTKMREAMLRGVPFEQSLMEAAEAERAAAGGGGAVTAITSISKSRLKDNEVDDAKGVRALSAGDALSDHLLASRPAGPGPRIPDQLNSDAPKSVLVAKLHQLTEENLATKAELSLVKEDLSQFKQENITLKLEVKRKLDEIRGLQTLVMAMEQSFLGLPENLLDKLPDEIRQIAISYKRIRSRENVIEKVQEEQDRRSDSRGKDTELRKAAYEAQKERQRKAQAEMDAKRGDMSPAQPPTPNKAAALETFVAKNQKYIDMLLAMGFEKEASIQALYKFRNVEQAANYLGSLSTQ